MKARSIWAFLLILAMGVLAAVDAVAQIEVSVQDRSFAWTGKSGQNANFRWTATIDNPSGSELNVRVTIELLDGQGAVVAQDSANVMLPRMDRTSVEQTGSVAVSTAEQAMQYRVVLAAVE